VGRKSGSVHPTASTALLYPFFSLHSQQETGLGILSPEEEKDVWAEERALFLNLTPSVIFSS